MYKIGEWAKVRKDFKECFEVSFAPFYAGLLTLAYRRIVMDIVKFDEWLEKNYPDEWENTSMENIIRHHYGQKGISIINALI
ncbi:MAG: hypothetical protein LBF81_05325 [Prevotellaceae bacterium]|jgi:hypothetical protein|nr:hypothetical protein [Prevotellaceae bacterium]